MKKKTSKSDLFFLFKDPHPKNTGKKGKTKKDISDNLIYCAVLSPVKSPVQNPCPEPMSVAQARLRLKAITVDDAEFYLSLMNCRTWIEFIGDRNVHTVDEARSYITRTMSKQWEELGYGNFIVFKKIQQETGIDAAETPIGAVGLFARYSKVDLGFAFLPEFEKLGYAYEASDALLKEAKLVHNITKISGITTNNNANCQKLLTKLGFHLKEETVLPNETRPVLIFEKEL